MLARELGTKAIAEGVETQFQMQQLHDLNCGYAQENFFGKPVPAQLMTVLLNSNLARSKRTTLPRVFSPLQVELFKSCINAA